MFFLGNCYLNDGLNSKNDSLIKMSIKSFTSVSKDSPYYLSSRWYSALAHAGNKDIAESTRLLDSLAQTNSIYSANAKRFVDSIRKLARP